MDIVSGAGHDAVYIAGVAPTGMIFVPCEDGISHNEIENATPEDCAAGCQVLLHAILARAEALDKAIHEHAWHDPPQLGWQKPHWGCPRWACSAPSPVSAR